MAERIPHPTSFVETSNHHKDCFFANPTGFFAIKNACTCALIKHIVAERDAYHENPCMICGPHTEYATYICENCEEELANEAAYDGGEL